VAGAKDVIDIFTRESRKSLADPTLQTETIVETTKTEIHTYNEDDYETVSYRNETVYEVLPPEIKIIDG